jgi:hypothetical protein
MGDGLYRINISNLSSIYNNGYIDLHTNSSYIDFSHSQIERAHNGFYYMVKPNGELRYFTNSFSGISYQTNIGSNAVINNAIHANDPYTPAIFNFYLIPDQIDGCEYTYTNGDEVVCCDTWTTSRVVRSYNYVSHENGDVNISAGANLMWTPTSNPWTIYPNPTPDVYLEGSINIAPGAILSFSGLTVHFKEGEGINMTYSTTAGQKGSRLNVFSNSKLTAYDECDEDVLWNGVNCFGEASLPQTPLTTSQQPYINVSNSTIEFAEIGIEALNGGIVRTSIANFKDNISDVKFSGNNNYTETDIINQY